MFEKKYHFLELLLIDIEFHFLKKGGNLEDKFSGKIEVSGRLNKKYGSRESPPANLKTQIWETVNRSLSFAVK